MKVGDKVTYIGIAGLAPYTKGKVYKVLKVDGGFLFLKNDMAVPYWWYTHTFKLVNEHKLSYKRISRRKHG